MNNWQINKAGLLVDNDTELVEEMESCQAELRELMNRNRWYAIILQKMARNHDKLMKNQACVYLNRLVSTGTFSWLKSYEYKKT